MEYFARTYAYLAALKRTRLYAGMFLALLSVFAVQQFHAAQANVVRSRSAAAPIGTSVALPVSSSAQSPNVALAPRDVIPRPSVTSLLNGVAERAAERKARRFAETPPPVSGGFWTVLSVGKDGQVLTTKNGSLSWEDPSTIEKTEVLSQTYRDPRGTRPETSPTSSPRGGGGSTYNPPGPSVHNHENEGGGGLLDINSATNGTLGQEQGGTGFGDYETGDLLIGNDGGLTKRTIGNEGEVLAVSGSTLVWKDAEAAALAGNNARYVNVDGDTMTGALNILTPGDVGLNVDGTMSGAALVVSGDATFNGTSTFNGAATLTNSAAMTVALTVKGAASQSANLQEWQDSNGVKLLAVGPTGILGDGTGNIYLNSESTYVDNAANLILGLGAVALGSEAALGQDSLVGKNSFTLNWSSGNFYYDTLDTGLARSAAGTLKVTNGSTGLGSLSAATLSGSAVMVNGPSTFNGATTVWSNNVFSGSPRLSVLGYSDTHPLLTIGDGGGIGWKFNRTSGNQQWLDHGGMIIDRNASRTAPVPDGTTFNLMVTGSQTDNGLAVRGAGSFQGLYSGPYASYATPTAMIDTLSSAATKVGIIVKGAASQTANLQEWQNSDGVVYASINPSGGATFAGATIINNTLAVGPSPNDDNAATFIATNSVFGNNPTATIIARRAAPGLVIRNAESGQTPDLQQWQNSDGDGLAVVDADGNVGIGTTEPGAKLSVDGTADIGGSRTGIDFGGLTPKLYVAGTLVLDNDQSLSWRNAAGTSNSQVLKYTSSNQLQITSAGQIDLNSDGSSRMSLNNLTATFQNLGGAGADILRVNTDKFVIDTDGNVGIGTASPGNKLDIINGGGNTDGISFNGKVALSANASDTFLRLNQSGEFTAGVYTPGKLFATEGFSTSFAVSPPSNGGYFAGNVGIGTTEPGTRLQVDAANSTNGTEIARFLGGSDSHYLIIKSSNGIDGGYFGTPSLHSSNEQIGICSNLLMPVGKTIAVGQTTYNNGEIQVGGGTAQNGLSLRLGNDPAYQGPLLIKDGSNAELMRITAVGNVGIGDASPSRLLSVGNGDLFTVDATGQANAGTGGLVTKVLSADCDDSQFSTDTDGLVCVSSANGGRLWFRYGGGWHYVAQDGGFQVPHLMRNGKLETDGLAVGDAVIGRLDERFEDGALHGVWEKFDLQTEMSATLRAHPELLAGLGTGAGSGGESLSLNDIRDLAVQGTLIVYGNATFMGDVKIHGTLTLGAKQAGMATIRSGQTQIRVNFEDDFGNTPLVTATPQDVPMAFWGVTDVMAGGFTIQLSSPTTADIRFAWIALPSSAGAEEEVTAETTIEASSSSVATDEEEDEATMSFPVDSRGVPVSSDAIWNACIRNITPLDSSDQPYNCNRYHDGHAWDHPDLMMSFTWNPSLDPPRLTLPEGYGETIVSDPDITAGQEEPVEAAPNEAPTESSSSSENAESSDISSAASEPTEQAASSAANE